MNSNEIFGLELTYKNHRLSKSRLITEEQMDLINLSCANHDLIFILCGGCNKYMSNADEGYWICNDCGVRVFESTVYKKIDKENTKWMERMDDMDVPEGCSKCGGPYPDCTTGCKLFND